MLLRAIPRQPMQPSCWAIPKLVYNHTSGHAGQIFVQALPGTWCCAQLKRIALQPMQPYW